MSHKFRTTLAIIQHTLTVLVHGGVLPQHHVITSFHKVVQKNLLLVGPSKYFALPTISIRTAAQLNKHLLSGLITRRSVDVYTDFLNITARFCSVALILNKLIINELPHCMDYIFIIGSITVPIILPFSDLSYSTRLFF